MSGIKKKIVEIKKMLRGDAPYPDTVTLNYALKRERMPSGEVVETTVPKTLPASKNALRKLLSELYFEKKAISSRVRRVKDDIEGVSSGEGYDLPSAGSISSERNNAQNLK